MNRASRPGSDRVNLTRRRKCPLALESLEERMVLSTGSSLAQIEGPAFAVTSGLVVKGRYSSIAAFQFAPGELHVSPGHQEFLRVAAVSGNNQELPVTILTRVGTLTPQYRELGGSAVGIASLRNVYVRVDAKPGTSFQVFVSLPGDINGDYQVSASDKALFRAGFGGLNQVPPGSKPAEVEASRLRASEYIRAMTLGQGESVTLTTPDLALGTRFVYLPSSGVSPDVNFGNGGGHWQLYVGGLPFYILGATGDYGYADPSEWGYDYLNSFITNSGVNTLRTYGLNAIGQFGSEVANTSAALAQTAKLSTTQNPVMLLVGLGVDETQTVAANVTAIEGVVKSINADPNASHILGWCIGNEIKNSAYYAVVNTVAAYIHTLDKAPVMTAVPSVTTGALQTFNADMPNIDWLGINTFYGAFDANHSQNILLAQLDATMAKGTWTKPWAVTEFYSYDLPSPAFGNYQGMPSQTLNGTPYYLELNSTSNAQNYAASWTNYIVSQKTANNVGGFALNWMPPHSSEVPAFWKDMFVYEGAWQIYVNPYGTGTDRLQAVDSITQVYGETPPSSGTPQIIVTDGDPQAIVASFKATLTSPGTTVVANQSLTASITASDALPLTFDWYLVGGTNVTSTTSPGIIGSGSTNPFAVYGLNPVTSILVGHGTTTPLQGNEVNNSITFTMPNVPAGNVYQLRVIIRDGEGGAATAAIGFGT